MSDYATCSYEGGAPLPEEGTLEHADFWAMKYIYGLVDPESGQVRYIGKSIRPAQRLQNHMNEVSNCHRSHWLQALKKKGLRPGLVIFEAVQGDWPWQESERFWIKRGRALGWPLTNNTNGGDGVSGLPAETRERMRKVWLGRKHKPETLAKLSAASKGRAKTPQQKEHMRNLMAGREITWAHKVAAAVRKLSEEDVSAIKQRLAAGDLVKNIAAEYKVDRTTISKVKMGTYHLPYRKAGKP